MAFRNIDISLSLHLTPSCLEPKCTYFHHSLAPFIRSEITMVLKSNPGDFTYTAEKYVIDPVCAILTLQPPVLVGLGSI